MPEPNATATPPPPDRQPPLVVDVDGTLVRGDLFLEGLVQLCLTRPGRLMGFAAAWIRGRGAAKAFVARETDLTVAQLPLEPAVLERILGAQATGRTVILASGAHETQVAALGARIGVAETMGSTEQINLTGKQKLRRIQSLCSSFDYIGNGHDDLPLWGAAREALAVNPSTTALWRGRRLRPDLVVLGEGFRWTTLFSALRPHQWSKNALLFLPALAAHLPYSAELIGVLGRGFVALSAVASAVYLLNDLADLPQDRRHPTKRQRPLAAGQLSIPVALAAVAVLLTGGGLVAWSLPREFQALVGLYLLLTTAYSFQLKRRMLADVMTLTTLYTLRIVAGAVLASVALSQWFVAFSVFFFLSLALLKRVAELHNQPEVTDGSPRSRPYLAADLPTLAAFGAASSAACSLVYCLYITSDSVEVLYRHPERLWVGLPVLIYWQLRVWLFGGRGRMNEDPVSFALRDRVSYMALAALLLTALLAR